MGSRYGVAARWAALLMGLSVGSVHADAQDDAIRLKCPGATAWEDNMRAAHPGLSDEARLSRDKTAHVSDPALRDAIHTRFVADQAARKAWIDAGGTQDAGKIMTQSDTQRLAWLKPRFASQGFPTVAQVGYQGIAEAFTLVEHATQDPGFQASMLPAVTKAARADALPKGDVAMLTDRILRLQGKPQRYGTQYISAAGDLQHMIPQPTEDPAHVDERRAAMNLMPQKDYGCVLSVVYTPAAAAP